MYIKREDADFENCCTFIECSACQFYVDEKCIIQEWIKSLPTADVVERKDFDDVLRRMGERNCFTCGTYREGEYIGMARNPEKVTAEELEADDRLVSLAEVCKIIQDTYEVCPRTWQRLRELPSADVVEKSL